MHIAPKNWREFQHYKDRSPPWIRLHRKLLDDRDFHRLPVSSRALAPMLWLLASESVDGVIDADTDNLAFRLRSNEKEVAAALRPLLERGFFVTLPDESKPLASRLQSAVPETETETEAYTETEKTFGQPAAAGKPKRDPAKSAETWIAYIDAYRTRYGVEPLRNAQVNSQMAQFVAKVDITEAPEIAAFYVRHSDRYYVTKAHSVGMLLRDAEKLRMEWVTGRQVTVPAVNYGEPAWRAEQRERTQQAAPGVAVHQDTNQFFDLEAEHVPTRRLG